MIPSTAPPAGRAPVRTALLRTSLFLAVLTLAALPAQAGKPSLRWKKKTYALDALPAELPAEVAEAVRPWGQWAERKGYRIELTPGADCVLVLSRRRGNPSEELAWIAATTRFVDGFLPPRPPATPATSGGGAPTKPGRLEDFDLPSLTPDAEMPALPHQVPVLLEARNPRDYDSALDALVEAHPWLEEWAASTGRGSYGLVLPRPLLGAWLADAPANEEWDPRNELVHRLAQLLVIDRVGVQPYWLQTGIAWDVELEVRSSIYCFPYRDEFVGIGEHGGWAPLLRTLYRERADSPPTAEEVTALRRGTYVDQNAALAWGTARWLRREQGAAFPRILRDLDAVRRKQGIDVGVDGSWTTRPGWDWPPATFEEVLRRHAGRDALARLGKAFGAGL